MSTMTRLPRRTTRIMPSKFDKYRTGKNRHHLTPRSRGGENNPWNVLTIHVERHFYWHKVFGNRTLDEAIDILCRLRRAKGYQKHRRVS